MGLMHPHSGRDKSLTSQDTDTEKLNKSCVGHMWSCVVLCSNFHKRGPTTTFALAFFVPTECLQWPDQSRWSAPSSKCVPSFHALTLS